MRKSVTGTITISAAAIMCMNLTGCTSKMEQVFKYIDKEKYEEALTDRKSVV